MNTSTSHQPFLNKVAIVTGAANGIGFAAAKLLSARGASVMLVDRDRDALAKRLNELDNKRCKISVTDVSDADQVAECVQQTRNAFGDEIDCFFNNAGIEGPTHPLLEYPIDAYDVVMGVNTKGVLIGLQQIVPHMPSGSSVVITSSVAGEFGSPGLVAYHASKHAILGIMRTAALEFAPLGIRVNTINPGAVNTQMFDRITENSGYSAQEYAEAIKATVPLGRYSEPQEIAELALFLLSDAASYCHGRSFGVDGGITAST